MAATPRADSVGSTTIFLVLRRMRLPLIVLIANFAITVLGLTLVPGQLPDGTPWRMSFFDAFYVITYTATSVGLGELPYPFTSAQRMWITVSIYLSVVAWAYAIGSLLSLLRDKSFRAAIARQRFASAIRRMREPFIIVAGFGQAGSRLCQALDVLDIRSVVVDEDPQRIESLDLGAYRTTIPGLAGAVGNPETLEVAGLRHRFCRGLVAITDDDEANLAATMTAALARPRLPVIASTTSHETAGRMRALGQPLVINPFDLFGDDLMLAVTKPAVHRLTAWLADEPGRSMPARLDTPQQGAWVVCGFGAFGREMLRDLRREGVSVIALEPLLDHDVIVHDTPVLGRAGSPSGLAPNDAATAAGIVAATDNDILNLSIIVEARRQNPGIFVVARQNDSHNSDLFRSIEPDAVLIPSQLVAREALARLGSPMLWQLITTARTMSDAWASATTERIAALDEGRRPDIGELQVTPAEAPALARWMGREPVSLEDILRDPEDRSSMLDIVVLLLQRGEESVVTPDAVTELRLGDRLLIAAGDFARRGLDTTVSVDPAMHYVMTGEQVGAGAVWRALSRARRAGTR